MEFFSFFANVRADLCNDLGNPKLSVLIVHLLFEETLSE